MRAARQDELGPVGLLSEISVHVSIEFRKALMPRIVKDDLGSDSQCSIL